MNNKANLYNIIAIIISLCILITIIGFIAYASFTPVTVTNELIVNTSVGKAVSFTATRSGAKQKMSQYVTAEMMEYTGNDTSSEAINVTNTYTIKLESDGVEEVCCTYNFSWKWTETSDDTNKYSLTSGAPNNEEYVLVFNKRNASGNPQLRYQVPNYDTEYHKVFTNDLNICVPVNSTSKTEYWDVSTVFYNLENISQGHLMGASLSGTLAVDNVSCSPGSISDFESSFETDSWETIAANVASGNTDQYNVGDTKCITLNGFTTTNNNGCGEAGVAHNGFKVRLVNKSTPSECSTDDFSKSACGFVIQFDDIIAKHSMNSSSTNVGGWPTSTLHQYLTTTIFNSLPISLKNLINETYIVSSHGSTSGETNFSSTDKLYLLSPEELQGTAHSFSTSDTALNTSRQLDYYAANNVSSSNSSSLIRQYNATNIYYWLRAAYSDSTHFYDVRPDGTISATAATTTNGVLPAFRIG